MSKDEDQSKAQLIDELKELRRQVAELEVSLHKRERADEELVFTNALLDAQLETSIDGILVVGRDGKAILSNDRFREMWRMPQKLLDARDDDRMLEYACGQLKEPEAFLKRVRYLYSHPEERSRDEIALKDGRVLDRYSASFQHPRGHHHVRIWYFRDISGRKRAEERLKRYQLAVESAHDAIFFKDLESRYVIANPKAAAAFGLCREEVIGKNDYELLQDQEQARRNVEDDRYIFRSGKLKEITKLMTAADGQEYWFDAIKVPQFDDDGRVVGLVGIARDITEHRKAEDALRESEERYRELFDNMTSGVIVYEPADNGMDFTIRDVNRAGKQLCRVAKRDITGKLLTEIFPGVEEFGLLEVLRTVYKTGKPAHHPVNMYQDGRLASWFDNRVYKLPTGEVVAVFDDVSRQRRTEEGLREPEERHRAIFECAAEGILIADVETKQFLYANPALCRMLGYSQEEIRRMDVSDIHPKEALPHVISEFEAQARGEKRLAPNLPCLRKDGTIIYADINTAAIVIGGRECNVGFFTDVTRQRQLEEQVQQTQKMEVIGQLAGGIAHDFNNQLTGIMGYADILVARLEDERLRNYAEMVVRAAQRSADLTQQLLACARKGKTLSAAVNVHRVISEVVTLLRHSIDKRITIQQFLKANPPHTTGDPSQLQSAILNIALNARDAMPGGGKLVFSTEAVTLDEERCRRNLPDLQPGRYLRVAISDTGVGMDEDTRKLIFEPFFTTKDKSRGVGMGLAAVYGTIKNHQGAITVDSKVGHGSTFTLYLPLAEPAKEEAGAAGGAPIKGTARILLVDDEEMVRDMGARLLRELGYKVAVCKDGAEAVEYYRKSWEHVDLVILDMVMIGMGGRDAFVAMRRINPDIKALLVSGYSIDGEARSILDEGVLGFLQKPFRVAEFGRAVADALGY